jgi:hypothetical protein
MAIPMTVRVFSPTTSGHTIIGIQSPSTRALTVGFFQKTGKTIDFIPCRLNFGSERQADCFTATVESLLLPHIQKILKKYKPEHISTVTILRETFACNLPIALSKAGIPMHYGDCFIGANHIKTGTSITTSYTYENVEGLYTEGLWVMADSIAEGRNLKATLTSLLSKYHPKEIILICPFANRLGVNNVSAIIKSFGIPVTFVVWGALFGLEPTMHYDEPWGLPDCEPLDNRDRDTFVSIYGKTLCVGGDFGNDFFCPSLAMDLYNNQLKKQHIIPKIPSVKKILSIYRKNEFVVHETHA